MAFDVPDPTARQSNRPALAIAVAVSLFTAVTPLAVVVWGGANPCDDGPDCHEPAQQARSSALAPDSETQSATFLANACRGGHGPSCLQLAGRYRRADGVAYRPDRAKHLFREACELDSGLGCLQLADVLTRGNPSETRVSEALGALNRVCNAGNADGCERAAALYEAGRVVAKDSALAVGYRQRACELNPTSCPALERACERTDMPRCLLEERRQAAPSTSM
jgi:TPR repeat protein